MGSACLKLNYEPARIRKSVELTAKCLKLFNGDDRSVPKHLPCFQHLQIEVTYHDALRDRQASASLMSGIGIDLRLSVTTKQ